MGHNVGALLAEKLLFCFEDYEILLSRLQSLESDGANVSKTVRNKLSLLYQKEKVMVR